MSTVPTMKVKHASLPLLEFVIIDRADFDPEIHTPYETVEVEADSSTPASSVNPVPEVIEAPEETEATPTKKRRNTPVEG